MVIVLVAELIHLIERLAYDFIRINFVVLLLFAR